MANSCGMLYIQKYVDAWLSHPCKFHAHRPEAGIKPGSWRCIVTVITTELRCWLSHPYVTGCEAMFITMSWISLCNSTPYHVCFSHSHHSLTLYTAYMVDSHRWPGDYNRGLGAQRGVHPGQGSESLEGTSIHTCSQLA